jgi:DNA polymerase III beta subunit, central domain
MTANLPESAVTQAQSLTSNATTVLVTRARLCGALRAVEDFMCKDATRFHLNGAFIEVEASIVRLVATDGHTMARVVIPCTIEGSLPASGMIIACESVLAAIKLLKCNAKLGKETVALKVGPRSIALAMPDGTSCPLRIVDSTFPPYRQVIPSYGHIKGGSSVGVNPAYLVRAGEAIARLGREFSSARGVTMTLGASELDPILIEFTAPDLGHATIVIMPMRL